MISTFEQMPYVTKFRLRKIGEADTRRAADLLDQAVARDPNFLLAHCMLCKLNFTLYAWVDKTPAPWPPVENALKNAIRIAPESGEMHSFAGDGSCMSGIGRAPSTR